eukprot:GFUD01021085.1.p1 GENE.GFUD01021085.1~~GFUD01021085.1.p1  ORF type:complete len:738 (+),score=141.93 GFUD01021085.1:51-2264(+)
MSSDSQINVFYVIQTEDSSKHITKYEDSPTDDTADKEPSDQKKVYSCQFCPSQFDRALSLYGHLNTHKNEVFPCSVETCQQSFTSLKAFRKHVSEHNGTSHPYECDQCGLKFDRRSQLGYHIERNHEKVVNHICDICKKGFYKNSDYKNHLDSHSGIKKYSCEECGKGFSHVSNLNRHKRIHTNEKPYVCQDCGKRFNQTSTLNNHAKIHSANVFGQCPECPKKFKTGRVLLKHLRTSHMYSNENVRKVASNSVLFSHKKYLKLLTPTDTKEKFSKSFYCEVCGKQFSFKHQLKLHIVQDHEKQENFPCESCNQTFKTCDQLLGHPCKLVSQVDKGVARKEKLKNDEATELVLHLHNEEISLSTGSIEYTFIEESQSVQNNLVTDQETFTHKYEGDNDNEDNVVIESHVIIDDGCVQVEAGEEYPKYFQSGSSFEQVRTSEHETVSVQEIIKNYINPGGEDTQIVIVQNSDENYWEDSNLDTTTIEFVLDDDVIRSLSERDFENTVQLECSDQKTVADGQASTSRTLHRKGYILENVTDEGDISTTVGEDSEKDSTYKCVVCQKSFSKKCNLRNHMGLHNTSERKYKCEECSETFAWKSSLNRHKERQHMGNQLEYPCNWCEKSYKVLSILNDHVKRDHFHERKHQCDLCDKSFFKVNDLKYHKRVHLSIKPYVCSICGKKFSHVSHFYRHERIHTGEKPYKCDVCSKSFNQSNALKSHRKTHFREEAPTISLSVEN